jgi:hypothetical protein
VRAALLVLLIAPLLVWAQMWPNPGPGHAAYGVGGGGTTFTDTFSRTAALNGSTFSGGGATWAEVQNAGTNRFETDGADLDLSTSAESGTFYVASTSADVSTDNYYVEVVFSAWGNRGYLGIGLRGSTFNGTGAGADGYYVECGTTTLPPGTTVCELRRFDNDSVLDSDSTDVTGGGTLRIEVSGTSLTVLWNSSPILSATDSTFSGGSGSRKAAITIFKPDSLNFNPIASFTYGDL